MQINTRFGVVGRDLTPIPVHPGFKTTGESRTKQAFKKEADINNIMERYMRTNVLVDPMAVNLARQGQYGDFSSGSDFTAAQNQIAQMRQVFDALPSDLRDRFGNSPANMLDFMADPANSAECVALGLLEASPIQPVVEPPKAPEESPKAP